MREVAKVLDRPDVREAWNSVTRHNMPYESAPLDSVRRKIWQKARGIGLDKCLFRLSRKSLSDLIRDMSRRQAVILAMQWGYDEALVDFLCHAGARVPGISKIRAWLTMDRINGIHQLSVRLRLHIRTDIAIIMDRVYGQLREKGLAVTILKAMVKQPTDDGVAMPRRHMSTAPAWPIESSIPILFSLIWMSLTLSSC